MKLAAQLLAIFATIAALSLALANAIDKEFADQPIPQNVEIPVGDFVEFME